MKGWVLWAVVAAAVAWVVTMWRAYRLQKRRAEKKHDLIEALENGDPMFRYSEKSVFDRAVNRSLNRIVRMVSDTRQEIRQQEALYGEILKAVDTGIIVLDERNAVVLYNKAAATLTGLEMVTHLRQIERVSAALAQAIEDASAGVSQKVSFNNERGGRQVSVRTSFIHLAKGALRIVALNDIEHELDEKETQAWIRLTRVLTHEIMNAVTPMTSLSDTLLDTYQNKDAGLRTGLETIRETGKGLLAFVDSYRKFTRLPEPEPAPFYVGGFLRQTLELARHSVWGMQEIATEIKVEPADLMVFADESLIRQVVLNILKNARQAIGSERTDGRIFIHAYGDATGAVRIEIGNNGPKIEPEVAEEIFLPFFTTKKDGSGIGLAVSLQLMRLSGGKLTMRSDDTATVFTLLFP